MPEPLVGIANLGKIAVRGYLAQKKKNNTLVRTLEETESWNGFI